MSPPLVLVTRPEPDGRAFVASLRSAAPGPWEAAVAPLQRIAPLPVPPLDGDAVLVLTSRNAARATGGALAGRAAWCVGPATARAAAAAGLRVAGVGQGDAAALVAAIAAARPAGPLVHLRGEPSTGDVAGALRAAGLEARDAVVYRQEAAAPGPAFRAALAEAVAGRRVLAPAFSPLGARRLAREASGAPLEVVALSPAVAAALGPGPGAAAVCDRPSAEAMVAALAARLGPAPDAPLETGGAAR